MAENDSTRIQGLIKHIAGDVHRGLTPEDAATRLALILDEQLVAEALRQFREIAAKTRLLKEPGGILGERLESWYLGPAEGDKFWPSYKQHLRGKGWGDEALDSLDAASTKIVSCLSHPGSGSIRTRGLVVGHVQSGKTASYTAVIAKAADAQYQLFLVLSGMNNALRNQTQRRLAEDIVSLNPEFWIELTGSTRDFRATENVNSFLAERQTSRVLGVVKKNSTRLRSLRNWLQGARSEILRSCPVLVIDDEADEATPNSHPDPNERTAINQLLVEILQLLPKAAYVGYTATPFANLLIDPVPIEGLYPRDFIIDLPRSEGYFGPERIFGRDQLDWDSPDEVADGLDMIRAVPVDEAIVLHPTSAAARFDFTPEITPSLADALRYFWLGTAARLARGQATQHSTMLIHTSQYAAVHDSFRTPLDDYRRLFQRQIAAGDLDTIDALRTMWDQEQRAVPSAVVGEQPTTFDELLPFLDAAVAATEIKVENGRSSERIDYFTEAGEPGRVYIVIGGNVLSRGLTLEGLFVSFFIRTASAYDTLLQMGRWFGYRRGYADLPRIWMTEELRGYFYDLATVEREIRHDIDRYKNSHITPETFGVRIREHPHLAITSKLKMQHAVRASMSFSASAVQTLVFHHKNREWLQRNLVAGRALLDRIAALGIRPQFIQRRPHPVFCDVPAEEILRFLGDYSIHERHVEIPNELLRGYIRTQNTHDCITLWNVVVVTRADSGLGPLSMGGGLEVNLINRARFQRGDHGDADVKALMSQLDPGLDVDRTTDELAAAGGRADLLKLRDQLVPNRGLLLLYPVSKDSRPHPRSSQERLPLEAVEHVLGMAAVFPDAADATPQAYWTVDLSNVQRENAEIDDLLEVEGDF